MSSGETPNTNKLFFAFSTTNNLFEAKNSLRVERTIITGRGTYGWLQLPTCILNSVLAWVYLSISNCSCSISPAKLGNLWIVILISAYIFLFLHVLFKFGVRSQLRFWQEFFFVFLLLQLKQTASHHLLLLTKWWPITRALVQHPHTVDFTFCNYLGYSLLQVSHLHSICIIPLIYSFKKLSRLNCAHLMSCWHLTQVHSALTIEVVWW